MDTAVFFVEFNGNATCLICKEKVAVLKEYNLKRHYSTKHGDQYEKYQEDERKKRAPQLQRELTSQQTLFYKAKKDADAAAEASYVAGLVSELNSDQLILALEPEAASVWCKQLPSEGFVAEGISKDKLEERPGIQYMAVDCGGGTIDITVHEVLDGGYLKELHKASGGDMGGETANKKFKSFLRDIFHFQTWDKYVRDHPAELQKMMYEFNVQKSVGGDKDIYISCPYYLSRLPGEKQLSSYFENVEGVVWFDGSIKITYNKLQSFFAESVGRIVSEIRAIVSTPEISIDYILLVGGYASCKYLQKEIRMEFGGRCEVLCPIDANMAVAKGAVLFGHNPKIVASRVSALT